MSSRLRNVQDQGLTSTHFNIVAFFRHPCVHCTADSVDLSRSRCSLFDMLMFTGTVRRVRRA
jgi:hypothetical protein